MTDPAEPLLGRHTPRAEETEPLHEVHLSASERLRTRPHRPELVEISRCYFGQFRC